MNSIQHEFMYSYHRLVVGVIAHTKYVLLSKLYMLPYFVLCLCICLCLPCVFVRAYFIIGF
jgi:hypothetical protein